MNKYRKKPIVIEAMQVPPAITDDESIMPHGMLAGWLMAVAPVASWEVYNSKGAIRIQTLEGLMIADNGDYIIRGVKGEIYPCKSDIFEMTYEAV